MRATAESTLRAIGLLTLIALLHVAAPARAQTYDVQTFTEGEGLPSTTVNGLAQDPAGRVWFATRAGVAVYDGTDWTRYGPENGLTPADRLVIAIDELGVAWSVARTPGVDVAWLEGDRWISLPPPGIPRDCAVADMALERSDGAVSLALATSCGLALWRGERWRWFRAAQGLPDDDVTDALHFADGWIVATRGGLALLEDGSDALAGDRFGVPRGPVLGVDDDPDGSGFFVVGEHWLGRVTDGAYRPIVDGLEIGSPDHPRALASDGQGGVFVGNKVALYHYHPVTALRLLDETNGLASGGATDLLLDREGNVWVAALRGASRIAGFRFATYREEHGLLEDEVTAVLEVGADRMILGHRDGLTFWSEGRLRRMGFRGPVETPYGLGRVLDLDRQADGTIWIAAAARGLGRLRHDRIRWTRAGSPGVTAVLVDRRDHVWIADGLDVLVDRGAGFEATPYGLRGANGVRRLIQSRDGGIFAATMGRGLYRWNGEGWEGWSSAERPEWDNVWTVLERADDTTWVGTATGLLEIHGGTYRRVTSPTIERPIYFMVTDRDERVWFGTDNGVLRWDGASLDHFTIEDGLGGRETNRAAGVVDRSGRVWIGTTGGATLYRPELDRRLPSAPTLSLRGLEASGEPVALDGAIRLPADRNDLDFTFRSIYFSDPRGVRLQCRLEGFESEWSETHTSTDQLVRYTDLPPGKYRFHARAVSRAGVRSPPISSPEIVIAAPVWRRPWVWSLALAALVGLILGVRRYYYQARQAHRLEDEVQQRVAELQAAQEELDKARRLQSLGLLAGGIAHDFNNLLTVVMGSLSLIGKRADEASRKWIVEAESAISRARDLTGQLLTFSRGGAPVRNPARIDEVIRDSTRFVLSGSHVEADIDLPSDLRVVNIDSGQINQVLNNLLINAVQAMPEGGRVSITGRNLDGIPALSKPGRYVAIEVRDDGPGISAADLPRIFEPYFSTKEGGSGLGLATAYSIVNRHGGLLTVSSEPGRGSTFTIYLEASTQDITPLPVQREAERFRGVRALIMDDDGAVREVVRGMLEALGCRVSATADGEEAMARYERGLQKGLRYDVVILDLTVRGGLGGEETMRRLLQLDPEARGIAASGYGNSPVMASHKEYGFRAAMHKPFQLDALADALREALGARLVS